MRDAFADELTILAGSDPRVVILMGDIGNHMFDKFKELYPDRFFNCGIAESNMISVAAGLAMSGFRPFVYTFSSFDIGRPFEQIRVDLAFQNLPVVIVGLGGGLTYSSLGPTHYICEDLAITRVLPNMTVICPADAMETRAVLRASLQTEGPVFIRIGKKNEPLIYNSPPELEIGKGIILNEGTDMCILGTGTILPNIIAAAHRIEKTGLSTRVVSLHTIKPLDIGLLKEVFSHFPLIVTVEEHSLIGGLGSAVAEWLIDQPRPYKAHLERIGIPDEFLHYAIKQKDALDHYNLSPDKLAERLQTLYQKIA